MKRVAILGSTGSIGKNSLHVARHLGPGKIRITALAAKSNIEELERQAKEFSPELIAVYDKDQALKLQKRLPKIPVLGGMEGLEAVASHNHVDFVVSAISGTLGLLPTVAAIKAKKQLGLANKEALVSGGSIVTSLAKKNGVKIIPIDSEHSALFQCLGDHSASTVERLILTASGGPFRAFTQNQLNEITLDHALNHPTWAMGPKVTVDSSTLMNKGLEVIEAYWLFGVPLEKIEVVIHPQSIIHSMVEFIDNSMMAQMCEPSMIVPIQYALTYPERLEGSLAQFNFKKHNKLEFFEPDFEKFLCLKLAFQAIKAGGSLTCYMNAANEVLVNRFLNREISWSSIATRLEKLMNKHQIQKLEILEDVLEIDRVARREAQTE